MLVRHAAPNRVVHREDPAIAPVHTVTPGRNAQTSPTSRRYSMGVDEYWMAALWSILPTAVVALLFFWILRNILTFDRTERRKYAEIEAEERAKRGMPTPDD